METPATPYHQQQILNAIPDWTRQLHSKHINRLMRHAHNEHIQENGQPTAWFSTASAGHQLQLREAIRRRTVSRKRLAQALSELQTLPQFCEPLLKRALHIDVPLTEAQYCYQPFELVLTGDLENVPGLEELGLPGGAYQPQSTPEPVGTPIPRSLLEAAMHNFEGMTEVGPFSTLQVSPHDPAGVPGLSVTRFVTRCRELDLGKRYQTHLDSVFNGTHKEQVSAAWVSAHRAELTVQAMIALIRNRVTQLGYEALRYFCTEGATPRYGRHPITVRSLKVLGMQVNDAMLLGPATTTDQDVIAYLPFDDDCPLQEFASLEEMTSYLIDRLRNTGYRQRFLEHIRQGDRPKMSVELDKALLNTAIVVSPTPGHLPTGIRPLNPPDLSIRERQITAPYWDNLYDAHVLALKDNARAIAVPTAEADAKARQALLESWEELGLNVLNVAALFVPGLDVVMLGVFAVQLMENIFHAYEAWREGDNAEAVAQVESLLLTFASAAIVGVAAKAVKASGFVDWLKRIVVAGEPRLWQPQLEPYRSPVKLPSDLKPDTRGLYAQDDRQFVRLDGDTYEVAEDAEGQWRLLHPQSDQAYRPRLHTNARGAWRLAHERVADLDTPKLLRRLAPDNAELSDSDLLAALDCTGLDRGNLQPVLIDGQRLPPLLEDALLRLRKDREADDIIARIRHGQPLAAYKNFAASALSELPGWPEDVVIQVFDGPEPWGSATRYGHDRWGDREISLVRDDLEKGDLARVVLEHLGDDYASQLLPSGTPTDQRQQALQNLLAEHLQARRQSLFDSLYRGHHVPMSPASDALGRQFSGLPDSALDEIVEATSNAERSRLLTGRVPLRVAEEARALQARVRLDRALLGLYRASLENTDSQTIRAQLLAERPEWTAEHLYLAARTDRAKAARLIGQQPIRPGFRSPMRLSDGRVGYPLSPGFFSSREEHELHALFPEMRSSERRAFLETLRRRGNVTAQLQAYRTEVENLQQSLENWAAAQSENHQHHATRVVHQLLRAWRRMDGNTLTLSDLDLAGLPPLTTRLDHITEVRLNNVSIPTIPADLMQSFPATRQLLVQSSPAMDMPSLFESLRHAPNLRELSIESSGLARLPASAREVLPTLTNLHILALRRNEVALSSEDIELLTGMRQLRVLDLYHNRITLDIASAVRFNNLRQLRLLNVGDNPLGVPPSLRGLMQLETLNLDNCELVALPEGLHALMNSDTYLLRHVQLSRNQIADIPHLESFLETPFVRGLRFRLNGERLHLNYNPLSPNSRIWLRSAGAAVEITPPVATPRPRDWLATRSDAQRATWQALFDEGANADLQGAVQLAGMSRAAQDNSARLSRQVWGLLESAAVDAELRARLNEVAANFPVTCGDAGADVLNTLLIEAKMHKLTAGKSQVTAELYSYFRRLFRRDQVNDLAQDIFNARLARRTGLLALRQWRVLPEAERGLQPTVSALHRFDQIDDRSLFANEGLDLIEIRLALRTNLADELDFDEPQTEMLYRDLAHVSMQTETYVLNEVLVRNGQLSTWRGWISRQPSWRRLLSAQNPTRFDGLRVRWDTGLDYLESCLAGEKPEGALEPPVIEALTGALGQTPVDAQGLARQLTINERQYEEGMRRMAQGLEDDEDALYLELTNPLALDG